MKHLLMRDTCLQQQILSYTDGQHPHGLKTSRLYCGQASLRIGASPGSPVGHLSGLGYFCSSFAAFSAHCRRRQLRSRAGFTQQRLNRDGKLVTPRITMCTTGQANASRVRGHQLCRHQTSTEQHGHGHLVSNAGQKSGMSLQLAERKKFMQVPAVV